jgi:RNA polymerase sigma-70 factor (ECF subfamily)
LKTVISLLQKNDSGIKLRSSILYLCEYLNGFQEIMMGQDKDPLLALLIRIEKRDEVAMAELYDAVVCRVYGLAIKIVRKPELAEEVVGDVFLQVWNKINNFDSKKASPMAWILMMSRSRALDKLRRERPELNNNISELNQSITKDKNAVTPYMELHGIDVSSRIHEALQLLNEKQRLAITLAFYEDMSQSEISKYTGDPIGTVKSNIRRAQQILKKTLSREDFAHGGIYGKA